MARGFINRAILGASADRIAKKAASKEAFAGGAGTAFGQEAVEIYFDKYGSTARKYDYHPNPGFYIGYVKIPGNAEFLSVVLMGPNGSVAASFWPDIQHGQDILGLTGKKEFADQVAAQFIEANGN